ncbi:MAG: ABC transporter ATP-binding protein [Lachnospiraceae bacterium]|nr:ABC transporter ATP-binding protein [Lachnospiraceae bacterium]
MSDIAIKIENLKKQYRLGAIGGRTLNAELQSWWARKRGKEDPNLKIGQDSSNYGETFWALKGINLEIKKGEAVGIIGANGAGKSTLLKILSRVTAPTEGDIWINGRIASMLEVGTGFHGEMTGRENIYMNGAILGMTRKEVDAKIESIIDFSECRQFIDTPVKRYSSGMYVKLAFAVASHLDAEIMVMDEVLAVGDINFQQKCLKKMHEAANTDGRTVLYVSHNMSTIRALCSRCIVLNKGKLIFDGSVEEGIMKYNDDAQAELLDKYDVSNVKRGANFTEQCHINCITLNKTVLRMRESLVFIMSYSSTDKIEKCMIRVIIQTLSRVVVATTYSDFFGTEVGLNENSFCLATDELTSGDYLFSIVLCGYENDMQTRIDSVPTVFRFRIDENEYYYNYKWDHSCWGYVKLNALSVIEKGYVYESK